MGHIASVSIEGFWETYSFSFSVDPHVTFLVGQNGTGKTTLINLVAAALTGDFKTLDRMPFTRVSIAMAPNDQKERASIVVSKKRTKDRPFDLIDYKINSGKPNTKDVRFSLDDVEEQLMLRRVHYDDRYMAYYKRLQTGLNVALKELVQVNWLSIHRTPLSEVAREARSYESSIDQKLESLSNDLVRYFATLSGLKDNEIRGFQESLFINLIEQNQSEINLFDFSKLDNIDHYEKEIRKIFAEIHVSGNFDSRLLAFVRKAKSIRTRTSRPGHGLDVKDAVFLFGLHRIDDVITRWAELQVRLKEIFAQRDRFIEIADDLFQRKRLVVTDSNELVFESRTGKPLTPQMLSSGEKQLLILMSEALLQRRAPSVFIADEPELSLHVLWQEKLISSLRALNPNAQIIAATHSPDIVGHMSKNAIDMEELIR